MSCVCVLIDCLSICRVRSDALSSETNAVHLFNGVCWESVIPSDGVNIATLPVALVVEAVVEADCVLSGEGEQLAAEMTSSDAIRAANIRPTVLLRCLLCPIQLSFTIPLIVWNTLVLELRACRSSL